LTKYFYLALISIYRIITKNLMPYATNQRSGLFTSHLYSHK